MGLAKRIIPCLDVAHGRVVKGVNFINLRDAGDPVEVARRYDGEGADELAFLDIRASIETRGLLYPYLKNGDVQKCPSYVGGSNLGGVGYGYSQGIFSDGSYDPSTYAPLGPASHAALTRPSETGLFGDCGNRTDPSATAPETMSFNTGTVRETITLQPPSSWCYPGFGCTASEDFRHQSFASFVFADGHTKAVKREAFVKVLPAAEQDAARNIRYEGDRLMAR